MNKSQLIDVIAEKTNVPKATVANIITEMHEVIVETLKTGDLVKVSGFGTFSSKKREAKKGRNPKTGETVNIPPRTVAKFKPSKELKEQLDA